jgi:hypothetical protein
MHRNEELLTALIKIKDQINQQIPLAANRFVEFECAAQDADEVDKKYAEHELRYDAGRIEYFIYEHINETLNEYFQQTELTHPKNFSAEQEQEAQRRLLSTAVQISKAIERHKRILSGKKLDDIPLSNTLPDYSYIKRYLEENAKQLIARWQDSQHLAIQDADFEQRFQLENLLVDYREKCLSQFIFNKINLARNSQLQFEVVQNLIKAGRFWDGIYFERIQSHTGFCGEYTHIALKKMFEDWSIYSQAKIEQVVINYFDDDDKPDDNHTFLAINRNPESKLNLPSTWGKSAILFDAWNKLVCFAEELDKQPLQYFAYPDGAKWEAIKFEQSDHRLMESLISMNDYYAIAGNEDLKQRCSSLMQEFQLTSLEANEIAEAASWLNMILKEVWPAQLKMKVLFFITTQGNQLVTTLAGFEQPALIIHRDFLAKIGDSDASYSVQELRFALARELLYIQHYGAGLTEELLADEEYRLDKLALEKTCQGKAAISYLQAAIVFANENPKAMKVPVLQDSIFSRVAKASNEQRIKAISAFIAERKDLAAKEMNIELARGLRYEIASLTTKIFYTEEFNRKKNKLEKLSYLQDQLQDLYIELLPYEYTFEPSIRVREFCKLLRELKLNLTDDTDNDELTAVHGFITRAFTLQIPAFIELYYAVCGLKPDQFNRNPHLPALGIFHEFQETIDAFINGNDYSLVKSAAISFLKIWQALRQHFVTEHISNPVNSHYRDYKKNHDGGLPRGLDRYFGSWIGSAIKWRGFSNKSESYLSQYFESWDLWKGMAISYISFGQHLPWIGAAVTSLYAGIQWCGFTMPWDEHLRWAEQDLDGDIRHTLWFLGVRLDSRLWDSFQPKELLDMINDDLHHYSDQAIPLAIELGGKQDNDHEYHHQYIHSVVTHFSRKHQCQESMWQQGLLEQSFEQSSELALEQSLEQAIELSLEPALQQSYKQSFEQAFIQFYDLNWIMLVAPFFPLRRNVDNEAIHSLLSHFAKAAREGSEKDKAVIKSFFLGREDKRDLENLDIYLKRLPFPGIDHNLIYTTFVLDQEHNGLQFKLFSLQEQIEFMNAFLNIYHDIDPMRLIKLFALPFNDLNHECLQTLIPLIKQHNMKLDWLLIGRILIAHVQEFGVPELFSRKGRDIIGFSEFAKQPQDRKKILEQFIWELPESEHDQNGLTKVLGQFFWEMPALEDGGNGLNYQDLIKIYHAFDANLLFPSRVVQHSYGQILLKKITRIQSLEERIARLQAWLFNTDYCLLGYQDKNYYPPMSDFKLRNQLVELFVSDLLAKYGKDHGADNHDNHDNYNNYIVTFKTLMDEIKKKAAKRDLKHTLARLMEAIEAQAELSDYAGSFIDAEKYEITSKRNKDNEKTSQLAILSALAQKIGEDAEGQKQLIGFLASPLSDDSLALIAEHIEKSKKFTDILKIIGRESHSNASQEDIKIVMLSLYHEFWSIKLKERAVVMESLLISPDKMVSQTQQVNAYQDALSYVLDKLFPNAAMDEDEDFARAFIQSYLDAAYSYMRSYLMAGLLVASNESESMGNVGAGKKLALFCESMGPAYVKLAQAIHSHPATPENIKVDLHHIKARANPPYRWDLWLLIDNVLPDQERLKIKRIGKLLGSASYNLALEAEFVDGSNVVLLLLRENAEKDAKNGFEHLKKTLSICNHARMDAIRDAGVSILEQAEKLSIIEMDDEKSKQQSQIASVIYQMQTKITKQAKITKLKIDNEQYVVNIVPTTIICSGAGYRFLTRMYGPEFNDLPLDTSFNRNIKKEIAKEVLRIELINILSASYFDSDRHGNQMRVHIDQENAQITLGLYDFGEMALEKPGKDEIAQMAKVISEIPHALIKLQAFDRAMDEVIARNIEEALRKKSCVSYLSRVRKAVLALQDFQHALSNDELFAVLKKVSESENLDALIKVELIKGFKQIEAMKIFSITETFFGLFDWRKSEAGVEDPVLENICYRHYNL